MPRLQTALDTSSQTFRDNRQAMLALLDEVRAVHARIAANSAKSQAKFRERGQLLPRERLQVLLDPGSDFVELCAFAGTGMHDDDGHDGVSGGSAITGIGFVAGVRCAVSASDSGIKGGAVSPMGMRKILRLQQVALENRLPLVSLVESAGANLMHQSEMFVEGGRTFANQARLSAAGIPQITVVHGSSTAGGAYMPGLSDVVVVVRDRAKIFLAGPPLLRAATGEIATDEELGGAELHASVTGLAELIADDDYQALQMARDVVAKLGWDVSSVLADTKPPSFTPDEIAGLVPVDYRKPYDVRELIARLVDDSDFLEIKADYGSDTVVGRAFVRGMACAFIGNNGPITANGAAKAAQFIQLCNQSRTPICFLQNTTGYMVGTEAERAGIVKHGSKMIQAVACSRVAHVTFLVGGAFGAGNYGMCGRAYDPRFIFSWPSARTAVMGPEQAATVMTILAEERGRRTGEATELEAMRTGIIAKMEPQTRAMFASARLWDDGIIDPRDTRTILAFCLQTCREAEGRTLSPTTFGVARM
jgi:geranyl-CoA carboxylase beta subunit